MNWGIQLVVCKANSLSGSRIGVASKYSGLEVRQTHSSFDACEQSIYEKECGYVHEAKGFDQEEIV